MLCLGCKRALRYIFLLHQTTTTNDVSPLGTCCVISFFYIKPQQLLRISACVSCCVISFFYIKPQLRSDSFSIRFGCVISFFYIKPQLAVPFMYVVVSCVISFFYIKPQHFANLGEQEIVALYLSSTSNHNFLQARLEKRLLRYIFLLHQTTTINPIH